jgi:hypothetical protein
MGSNSPRFARRRRANLAGNELCTFEGLMSETIRWRLWAEPGAAGRCELYDPEAVIEAEVGVEPPSDMRRRDDVQTHSRSRDGLTPSYPRKSPVLALRSGTSAGVWKTRQRTVFTA